MESERLWRSCCPEGVKQEQENHMWRAVRKRSGGVWGAGRPVSGVQEAPKDLLDFRQKGRGAAKKALRAENGSALRIVAKESPCNLVSFVRKGREDAFEGSSSTRKNRPSITKKKGEESFLITL